MNWHNRDKKLKRRHSHKDMGKPFKRTAEKDSYTKKQISKFRKKLKQEEQQAEKMADDMDYENYQ